MMVVFALQSRSEVRIPMTQGIAGHVATSGQLLNIRDAQNHPLFYKTIDQETGFTTRCVDPCLDLTHFIISS